MHNLNEIQLVKSITYKSNKFYINTRSGNEVLLSVNNIHKIEYIRRTDNKYRIIYESVIASNSGKFKVTNANESFGEYSQQLSSLVSMKLLRSSVLDYNSTTNLNLYLSNLSKSKVPKAYKVFTCTCKLRRICLKNSTQNIYNTYFIGNEYRQVVHQFSFSEITKIDCTKSNNYFITIHTPTKIFSLVDYTYGFDNLVEFLLKAINSSLCPHITFTPKSVKLLKEYYNRGDNKNAS